VNPRRLYRSRRDRRLAGIAGGIGEYLEIDPTVVRVLWILSIFFGGFGILLYIVMAFVVPLEPAGDASPGASQAAGAWQAPGQAPTAWQAPGQAPAGPAWGTPAPAAAAPATTPSPAADGPAGAAAVADSTPEDGAAASESTATPS